MKAYHLFPLLAVSLSATSALAQEIDLDRTQRLRPVTAPLRPIGGSLDLSTGRFRLNRTPSIGNDGTVEVYDNTCPTPFYLGLQPAGMPGSGSACPETLGDYGAIPSTAFPGDATCTAGCADSYDITRFEIAWCQVAGPPAGSQILLHFWDAPVIPCAAGNPMGSMCGPGGAPAPATPTLLSGTLSGLPRSNSVGTLACYVLTIDLGTPGFPITGSDTFAPLDVTGDKFAWSFTMPTSTGGDGPVLAGDLTPFSSPCAPCAGTLWEVGGQSSGAGTGAGQANNIFWEDYGGTSAPSVPPGTCFILGSPVPTGMHLELFANKPCFDEPESTTFCDGGDGALASCPCGPGSAGTGCDTPIPPMQGGGLTGGVSLRAFSQETMPSNRATLQAQGFPAGSAPAGVVFRNTGIDPGSPVVFGDGVRCVDTIASPSTFVRLGAAVATGGTMQNTFGHGAMAGSGTFFYQLWFRSTPVSYCDPSAAFNTSNGVTLDW